MQITREMPLIYQARGGVQGQERGKDKAWLAVAPRNMRTKRHSWHVAGGAGGRGEVAVAYA